MLTYSISDFKGGHIELSVSANPIFEWNIGPNMPDVPDFYHLMVFKVIFGFLHKTKIAALNIMLLRYFSQKH